MFTSRLLRYSAPIALFSTFLFITSPAIAQSTDQQHFNQFLNAAVCLFVGSRTSPQTIRQHARHDGYDNVRDIEFVARAYPERSCGYYTAVADRNGRTFKLYADAQSGRIFSRGLVEGGHDRRISESEVRHRVRHQGYRRIRNIRYVERNGDDFYLMRAHRNGNAFRLRVSDEDGEILNRRRVDGRPGGPELSEEEVREHIREAGYYRIHNLRHETRGNRHFYVARAWKNDDGLYRLRIDDEDGEIESRRRLRDASRTEPELDEAAIRGALRNRGYSSIRLRYRTRGNRDFYVARATYENARYQLRVSDETAETLARREHRGRRDRPNRADMSDNEIRQALRDEGYRRILNIRYVSRDGRDFYRARARMDGNVWNLWVEDSDGEVVRRREARSADRPMNEREAREAMRDEGFHHIRNLRRTERNNREMYVARARKHDDDDVYRVVIDARSGELLRSREID